MKAQGQQSSSKNAHPNEPSDSGQRASGRTVEREQISADRKKYLAKQYDFTEGQVEVVRLQLCPTATDAELELFIATCRRVKLDPFTRQIFFIKRKQRVEDDFGNASYVDVGRPETSIDGLRSLAEQTGSYEGQAPIEWCGADGKWTEVWLDKDAPHAARATVFRKGHREPMKAVALFTEFCPRFKSSKTDEIKIPQMWTKMPANQIAKCAEAAALRRAFPNDMSGLYITEEMEHTSEGFTAPTAPATAQQAQGKVIDASSTKSLPAPSKNAIDASTMLTTIGKATHRGELTGVGQQIAELKRKGDASSLKILADVEPKMQERWRELPPAPKG
jgi:phage recombination protein Bet